MRLRCPHCHSPIEVVGTQALSDVSCPSCGSSFNLMSGETTGTYKPDGSRRLGHFELLEQLGIGHFGSVWKARDTELDRLVAIKIPRKEQLEDGDTEMFFREARAAAQLRHPNIVSVHEVGRADDTVYIASDYIQGANLKEWLTGQRLTFRESAELCVTIATALHHAHESGVTHRDLKPANILMGVGQAFQPDPDARHGHAPQPASKNVRLESLAYTPYITDFGLAKRESGEITMTVEGQILGTPAYMSPEQARGHGHHADRRSDIYSLGVILFELLTGERPFRGETRMLIVQILKDEPPSPRKLNARIPRDLETICLKCLEKDPQQRYASAPMFAGDLRCYLDGKPIAARPVSSVEHGLRWCRRNPVVAGLGTTIALLLIAATAAACGVAIWSNKVADDERIASDNQRRLTHEAKDSETRALNSQQKAIEEEQKARRSEAEALAVLEFFQEKVLAAARPEGQEGGLGVKATIRSAVDAAEPQIGPSFRDQPLVEASIRDAIGQTYWYLREAKLAVIQFERVWQLHASELGPDNSVTLSSQNNLAEAYRLAGQLDKAIPLFEETLEKRKASLGVEHADTLVSVNNLTAAYFENGMVKEAVPLFEQTLEMRRVKLGSNHLSTISSMNNLAEAYRRTGKFDKAIPLAKETLQKYSEQLTADHPNTLNAMNNLAAALQANNQRDEALSLFEQALEKRKTKLGLEHADTVMSTINLAAVYDAMGKLEQAEPLFREGVVGFRRIYGNENANTQLCIRSLANCYAKLRQPEKAEPLLRELAAFRKDKEPNSSQYAVELVTLGQNLLDQQRPADAEPVLRECLLIREKVQSDIWTTFNTKSLLGGSLLGQKKFADAEPLLLSGYEGMNEREAKIPPLAKPRLSESLNRLIQLYDAWDKPEQAAAWRQKLTETK